VIVVDASALTAFILREEGWRSIARYIVRCISVDHIVKEVVNAIWRATYLRKLISIEEAFKAYSILMQLVDRNIILYPEAKYLQKALEISLRYGITVYDALYIALALEERKPLLTLDSRQSEVAKALGVTPVSVQHR